MEALSKCLYEPPHPSDVDSDYTHRQTENLSLRPVGSLESVGTMRGLLTPVKLLLKKKQASGPKTQLIGKTVH